MTDGGLEASILYLLRWWAAIFLLGAAYAPLVRRIWPGSWGWAAAKTLALLVTAYVTWLATSLGLRVNAAAVGLTLAVLALALALALNKVPGLHRGAQIGASLRAHWRQDSIDELLFIGLLIFWSSLRATVPGLLGTEKFMDFSLLVSCREATTLPPPDAWFSGERVNYYYFGHYVGAVLSRLSVVPAPYAYNLMLSSTAALTMLSAFALVRDLLRAAGPTWRQAATAGGLLTAVLLGLGGNLHTFVFGVARPIVSALGLASPLPAYWYPSAARFVGHEPGGTDKTINEFPSYSFVVGDLHAHLLNLPFVLLMLMLLSGLLMGAHGIQRAFSARTRAARLLPMALLLAAMAMTNSWAFPVYLLAATMTIAVTETAHPGTASRKLLRWTLSTGLLVLAALSLAWPFFASFVPFGRGVGVAQSHTKLWQMLVLYGYQCALLAAFGAAWAFSARLRAAVRHMHPRIKFLAMLLTTAFICIAVSEVLYVKDIYGLEYQRANTVFKLGYEAFTLLTVCAGCCAVAIVKLAAELRPAYRLGVGLYVWFFCVAATAFAAFALPQTFPQPSRAMTLDALAFMARDQPEDRQVVHWLQQHAQPGSRIVEADGFSYTYAGRISMASGFATLIGWHAHELLWRPDIGQAIEERSTAVRDILVADDCKKVSGLLDRYRIDYLVVGKFELERLPNLSLARLEAAAQTVARFGTTSVLKTRAAHERCSSAP
ncbi:DUF2298 domain-containing protein [Roseateles sp.]|uniref:DUF2298 domain-containing protein n=1 Tax=Roseateles sp. TaxID=1971397 RepID=UPI003265B333